MRHGAIRARVALATGSADYQMPRRRQGHAQQRAFVCRGARRNGFESTSVKISPRKAFRPSSRSFTARSRPAPVALIFFSGYGVRINRRTYMVPVNAQIWTEPDVRRDGYNLDPVLAEMNSKARASRSRSWCVSIKSIRAPLSRCSCRPAPVIAPNNTAVMYAAASMVVKTATARCS